jgi:hypothetical protein
MTNVQHRHSSWRMRSLFMTVWRCREIHSTKHFYAYGRTRGFLTTHACLSEDLKGQAEPSGLDLYSSDFCNCSKDSSPCEHYQLFLAGWKVGAAQAELVYRRRDQDLVEDLGRAASFTSRRPPRNYPWVSAWRDGTEARLHGEVFRRFISGWLQTGVDRRRIKGV